MMCCYRRRNIQFNMGLKSLGKNRNVHGISLWIRVVSSPTPTAGMATILFLHCQQPPTKLFLILEEIIIVTHVTASICTIVTSSNCRLVISSICRLVTFCIFRLVISSICRLVSCSICRLVTSSMYRLSLCLAPLKFRRTEAVRCIIWRISECNLSVSLHMSWVLQLR
jgi:hypothetical protein